jgi:hypothetical protein
MDSNECNTVIAARSSAGLGSEQILTQLSSAVTQFNENVKAKFKRDGEW